MSVPSRTSVRQSKLGNRLISLLLLGERPTSSQLIDAVNAGVPAVSVDQLTRRGLALEEIARVVGVSVKTLRRKRTARAKLNVAESDRLVRLVEVAAMAEDAIGNRGRALDWLRTPNWGLGNKVPLELIAVESGAQLVRQSLAAIAYGGVA